MRSVWLGLALVVACSGGGNDRAPATPDEGGASSSGGTRSRPAATAGKATTEAGTAGEAPAQGGEGAGEGGAPEGGSPIIYEMGGAPQLAPPGVCEPQMKLGSDSAEDVGVAAVTLLAMTSDELSVAFTTGSGAELELHVADRASTASEFVETGLSVPSGFDAASGVALSGDARRLVLVMSDHSGFGELSRGKRSDAFTGEADTTAFARINALKPMSGHSVGWPALSDDGETLYFLSYFGEGLINQSERGKDGVFDLGTEIDPFTLGGQAGSYKLLSGVSSDQRAIFFFDEASQHAMALFRSAPGAPFYDPLDLGVRRGVTPNAGCSKLYSSVDGKLVVQARK